MRGLSLITALCLITADTAFAASNFKGCFRKDFDKSYLKKNPLQFVTNVELEAKVREAKHVGGVLRFKLRDDKNQWWTTSFECMDSGTSWACGMECAGGGFLLAPGKGGLQLSNRTGIRVDKEDCGEDFRMIQADAAHDTFVLPQITSRDCKK